MRALVFAMLACIAPFLTLLLLAPGVRSRPAEAVHLRGGLRGAFSPDGRVEDQRKAEIHFSGVTEEKAFSGKRPIQAGT